MLQKLLLSFSAVVFISGLVMPVTAGPETKGQSITKQASLSQSTGYGIDGKRKVEVLQTLRPAPDTLKIAGRCGSSIYSCVSPGFLYCCGNSTDGFYCAANVNGCTR